MKNSRILLLVLVLIFSFTSIPKTEASSQMSIYVNYVAQDYSKNAKVEKGVTLVPMRGVFQSLGASVTYDAKSKSITAKKGNKTIKLVIGSKTAKVNGKSVKLLTAAKAEKGVTLVPLRFVSDALGEKVRWHAGSKSIFIGDPDFYSTLFGQSKTKIKRYETSTFIKEGEINSIPVLQYKSNLYGRSSTLYHIFDDNKYAGAIYEFFPNKPVKSKANTITVYEKMLEKFKIFYGTPTEIINDSTSTLASYTVIWERNDYVIVFMITNYDGKLVAELYIVQGL